MSDLMSPKIVAPAALFALLSPGMLLQLPTKIPTMNANAFFTNKTDVYSVLFHSLVFMIVYKMVARTMGFTLKRADLIVPTVLFVLLSPGLLLSVPPQGKLFMSGQTGVTQVLVHAIVFALVFAFLRMQFPKFY